MLVSSETLPEAHPASRAAHQCGPVRSEGSALRIRFVALAGFLTVFVACSSQDPDSRPSVMTHALEGMEGCLACHNVGAVAAVPDIPPNHAERGNETCLWCHSPTAAIQTAEPTALLHAVEGMTQCLLCHAVGTMEGVPDVPADHEGQPNESCLWCHSPSET